MRTQRRGLKAAMSPEEVDAFLRQERVCRLATVGPDGTPRSNPLWFVWHDRGLWLYSLVGTQRWANIDRNPSVSALIDAGHDYGELRGVELTGTVAVIGEVPRTTQPDANVEAPERLFFRKYFDRDEPVHDGRHAWLRLIPDSVVSWDFRKLARSAR
jgi:nitroimidazol reductase NimA-like FMN-containing flavoprotein (pyridoxamine 5'-phosphate oxidase superfamily)